MSVFLSVFKIREHGIQTRETLKIYDSRPKCDSNAGSFGSVRLSECYAVLLVLLYGMGTSVVLALCEILWKHKNIFSRDKFNNKLFTHDSANE